MRGRRKVGSESPRKDVFEDTRFWINELEPPSGLKDVEFRME